MENPGRILQCDIQRYHHTRPYENNEQVEFKSEPILFKENWAQLLLQNLKNSLTLYLYWQPLVVHDLSKSEKQSQR